MLEQLPKEVFWLILELVPDKKDLCAVSKTLYNLTLPKLYETVVISSRSERHLERIDTTPFLRGNPTSRLYHTKHIRVSTHFSINLDERCVHFRDIQHRFVEGIGDEGTEDCIKFQRLATSVMGLLMNLKDKTLKSFSWELGTCIPKQILGSMGYLPIKQTSLEAITLITGNGCPYEMDGSDDIDLSQFRALQRISWIGLQSDLYFQALRHALEINSRRLTHIRLEYVSKPDDYIWFRQYDNSDDDDSDDYDSDDDDIDDYANSSRNQGVHYHNFFARVGLGLKRSAVSLDVMFTSLSSLSLAFIPLKNAEKALVHTLNISGLRHLTLRECPGMGDFLEAVVASGQMLSLLSFEYNCGPLDEDIRCEALEDIFRIATNLTDIFLSLPGPTRTLENWRALARSKLPITRFVYHQRTVNIDDRSSRYEEEEDLVDLSLLPEDMDELKSAGEQHPFAKLNLACLGLGAAPQNIKWILRSPITTKSLKLLHIRKSGSDMIGSIETRGNLFKHSDLMLDSEDENDYAMVIDSDDDDLEDDIETHMSRHSALPDMARDSLFLQHAFPESVSSTCAAEAEANFEDLDELGKLPSSVMDFCHWAFGAYGIPSLQVLAYGDFSFEDRFSSENIIICRETWITPKWENNTGEAEEITLTFRPIRESHIKMKELVDENMHFLGACPVDPILVKSQ